jgi:hypothetical protein
MDPDPGDPRTCGSCGSGPSALFETIASLISERRLSVFSCFLTPYHISTSPSYLIPPLLAFIASYMFFYDVLFSAEFHEHIWTTCALLVLECNSDENIGFQIDLVRDIQELASNPAQNIRLSYASRYQESSIPCTV